MIMKKEIIGRKFLQPFFERLLRISLRGMNYGTAAYVETSGELHLLASLKRFYKDKKLVIFDIGSNSGQYLSYLKKIFKTSEIHAFEPGKKAYKELLRLKSENVYLHNFALSNRNGPAELFYDTEGTGWASMAYRQYAHLNVYLNKKEVIQTKSIDDFCKELKIERIHFCKMDIEGFELEALKGGAGLIELGKVDFIQFEFGLAAIETKVFLKDFFDLLQNYRIYRLLQDGIYPIKYDERYEIFLNSNYLAVHKSIPFKG